MFQTVVVYKMAHFIDLFIPIAICSILPLFINLTNKMYTIISDNINFNNKHTASTVISADEYTDTFSPQSTAEHQR